MKLAAQLYSTLIAVTLTATAQAGGYWGQGNATASVGAQVLPPIEVIGSDTPLMLAPTASEWLGSRITATPLKLSSDTSSTVVNISGEPDTTFVISLPDDTLIKINNGRQAALLNGTLSANLTTGLLDDAGRHRLIINADFSLADLINLQGLFSGNFPVTVEHN